MQNRPLDATREPGWTLMYGMATANCATRASRSPRHRQRVAVHQASLLASRSGLAIANGVASATVLHGSSMRAPTTALHVLGPEAGIAFANAHDLAALLLGRAERGFDEHVLLAANRMLA